MRRRVLMGGVGLVALASVGTVTFAQNVVFYEPFDSYATGSLLSTQGSPAAWIVDGCNDARVTSDNPHTAPNSASDYKGTFGRAGIRNRRDLTVAELSQAKVVHGASPTAINGTDENPLVLEFKLFLGRKTQGIYQWLNVYTELTCTTDRAPTPVIVSTCSDGKIRPHLDLNGDGQIHRTIALGQIAWADSDPCSDVTSQRASTYRLTIYDGQRWRTLQGLGSQDVHTCGGYNFVKLTVKTSTIDVQIQSFYNGTDCTGDPNSGGGRITYATTIPRAYTGVFNAVRFGGIPDELNGGCWGEDKTIDGQNVGYPTQGTSIDDIYLHDGEAFSTPAPCDETGACCLPDHTCQQSPASVCAAITGAVFKGVGTVCGVGAGKCCAPVPFDADYDGDVDMIDFAGIQRCITREGSAIANECKCFDTNDDGVIGSTEVERFILCAGGPGIPADPACVP